MVMMVMIAAYATGMIAKSKNKEQKLNNKMIQADDAVREQAVWKAIRRDS